MWLSRLAFLNSLSNSGFDYNVQWWYYFAVILSINGFEALL